MLEDDIAYTDKTQSVGYIPLEVVEPSSRTAALIVISGRSFGQSFPLSKEEMLLGRAPECDIRIEGDGISRRHCKIVQAEGKHVLLDVGSLNGTYHDGERIQALTLYDGAKIQIGLGTILRFQYQEPIDAEFQRSMYESRTRDAMTEAYNKRYFLEAIDREVAFARRHGHSLSLVMLDIDHFKRTNDTFGHQAGDLVLRMVAKSVTEVIRKEDVFARFGGEEFALLLRNTEPEMAFILAERIRRGVERLEIVHNGRRIPTTVSLGIAFLGEQVQEADTLIQAADDRLYRAKNAGRNRTESAIFD